MVGSPWGKFQRLSLSARMTLNVLSHCPGYILHRFAWDGDQVGIYLKHLTKVHENVEETGQCRIIAFYHMIQTSRFNT